MRMCKPFDKCCRTCCAETTFSSMLFDGGVRCIIARELLLGMVRRIFFAECGSFFELMRQSVGMVMVRGLRESCHCRWSPLTMRAHSSTTPHLKTPLKAPLNGR